MTEVENFLEHYGVKGMQWGVRKVSRSKTVSDDHKRAKELRKRKLSSLSNQEIKTLNERRNLEENHARLNPNIVRRGERHTRGIVATIGLATTVANLHNTPLGRSTLAAGQRFANDIRHPTSFGLNNISLTEPFTPRARQGGS